MLSGDATRNLPWSLEYPLSIMDHRSRTATTKLHEQNSNVSEIEIFLMRRPKATLVLIMAIAAASIPKIAAAQEELETPNLDNFRDPNGLDVLSRLPTRAMASLAIGDPENGGLIYSRFLNNKGYATTNHSAIINTRYDLIVVVGGLAKEFYRPSLAEARVEGYQFWQSVDKSQAVFTLPDGTRYEFFDYDGDNTGAYILRYARYPNGVVINYSYELVTTNNVVTISRYHLRSINNNLGYQIRINWSGATISDVVALNNSIEYCATVGERCDPSAAAWQKLSFGGNCPLVPPYGICQRTENLNGLVTTYNYSSNDITSIVSPTGRTISYTYDIPGSGDVTSITSELGFWSYDYDSNSTRSFNPAGGERRYVYGNHSRTYVGEFIDELGRSTRFEEDSEGRLIRVVYPEGNDEQYTYDSRGNITEVRRSSASSPTEQIVYSAVYDAACLNPLSCNKPLSYTDAQGNVTEYTYNAFGQVLTETGPAPMPGGVRPQTRNVYELRYAWYRQDGSGAITQAPSPVSVLVESSRCVTQPSCAGTADEIRTIMTYQEGSPTSASNLLPIAITTRTGDGALVSTTTTTYDINGDPLTVDGPLPGPGDTTRYVYDAMRRRVGIIDPNP
jgi:YD repeat-containing protein